MHNTSVVIMAGGRGERFWPKSSAGQPKHFLRLVGDKALLRLTYERIADMLPPERIMVVTVQEQVSMARGELPELPKHNFIAEPYGNDTASCMCLASAVVEARADTENVLFLPADHYIGNVDVYQAILSKAVGCLAHSSVVTVGIPPTRPETAYGYIETGSGISDGVFEIASFREKPSPEVAHEFFSSGKHFWNGGIFCWNNAKLSAAVREVFPEGCAIYDSVLESRSIVEAYKQVPRISFDYAVMQKYKGMGLVVRADNLIWDDLGSWTALERLVKPDESGNYVHGIAQLIDSRDCIVYSDDPCTVVMGASGLVVAHTDDGVLVSSREHLPLIREPVRALSSAQHQSAASLSADQKVVQKPWGSEIWWGVTDHYLGKILEVRAGHRLSLQYHEKKTETMYCLSGHGLLQLGEEEVVMRPGTSRTITCGTVHRLTALSDLRILEVSTPDPDDVVRVEDDYCR